MTDLTKITTPFGLLDTNTQGALIMAKESGAEIEKYSLGPRWQDMAEEIFWEHKTYRVRPEPEKVVHWANDYGSGVGVWFSTRAAGYAAVAMIRREQTGDKIEYFQEDV